ncbi:MAG: hypothetical protein H0V42_04305 [Nocardioidaceae bacterium]|nr:hypothetical protein [Nocardioidaceae bacterium]
MDLILTQRDQNAVHQLLLAKPEPGSLLPRAAVDALVRLIPCDTIGAGEADDHGFLLHGFDLPAGVYDYLGPQCCDGPLPTGLIHLGAFPDDDEDVLFMRAIGVRDVLRLGSPPPPGRRCSCT